MIHRLYIDANTTPESLKKQARKMAMTGGVVLRLAQALSSKDLQAIEQRFRPLASGNNLAAGVLRQIEKYQSPL